MITNNSPIPATPPEEASGPLTHSLACVHCGYELLSQPLHGNCPECGHPVQGSLHGDWLKFCHPAWTRSLALGISLVLLAYTADLLLYLGLQIYFSPHPYRITYYVSNTAFAYGVIALFQFAGLWCLTAQEPRLALREADIELRRILRTLLLPNGLAQALLFAVAPGEASWQASLFYCVLPVSLILICLMFYFLARLARRVPAPVLENQTLMYLWAVPGLVIIAMLARALQRVIRDPTFNMSRLFPAMAAGWLALWGYWLIVKYAIVLTKAARAARQNAHNPRAQDPPC